MNKKLIYIFIVVIAVIAVGLWLWLNPPAANAPVGGTPQGPQGNVVTESDTTSVINQDLNSITIEDPDFKNIDNDLNSL